MASASSQLNHGYDWKYLPIKLHRDTYEQDFYTHLLPLVKPDWKEEAIEHHIFKSGVTNTLVAFYPKELGLHNSGENVILLRVNGEGTDKIINRTDEVIAILSLGKMGFCPPLYAELQNGLCYGFSPGRRLKVCETSGNRMIMRKIAGLMAKLHSFVIPNHFKDREPFLWSKIDKWLEKVPTSFQDDNTQQSFLSSIGSIENLSMNIESIKNLLGTKCKSPIVFCHNDIHSANIIYNEKTGIMKLVDYEYTGPNYPAYDIANHFCEFAGVENVDFSKYPNEAQQKEWIKMYLEGVQKLKIKGSNRVEISDQRIHELYCEVNKLALGCHLLWTVWGLFQAAHSTIDFNFMEYASLRYKEFLKKKDIFSNL